MASTLQTGHRGSLRQRIVVLNGKGKTRSDPARVARDRYLRGLVRQGVVTAEQVKRALDEYARAPASVEWMAHVDPTTLGRADCVFLAEYGRFPSEAGDFEINGPCHRICRSLGYDWHYYDEQLAKLHWDGAGRPYVRPEVSVRIEQDVQNRETRKGNPWGFGFVLAVGVIGGPAAGFAALRNLPAEMASVVWGLGVVWLVCVAALLVGTWPRRIRYRSPVLRCGRCQRELAPEQAGTGCPGCGALFAG
jgi:hypothetical protein